MGLKYLHYNTITLPVCNIRTLGQHLEFLKQGTFGKVLPRNTLK